MSDVSSEMLNTHYGLANPGVPFHYGDVVCQHSSSSPSIIVRNFFTNHLSLCVITLYSRYDAPTSPTHKSLLQVHRIGNESLLQVPHTSPPKWHRVPLGVDDKSSPIRHKHNGRHVSVCYIDVPPVVLYGTSVHLYCNYQLGPNESLYSVKWYKNFTEFFSFVETDPNPIHGRR